jgi:hypothetical protein
MENEVGVPPWQWLVSRECRKVAQHCPRGSEHDLRSSKSLKYVWGSNLPAGCWDDAILTTQVGNWTLNIAPAVIHWTRRNLQINSESGQ